MISAYPPNISQPYSAKIRSVQLVVDWKVLRQSEHPRCGPFRHYHNAKALKHKDLGCQNPPGPELSLKSFLQKGDFYTNDPKKSMSTPSLTDLRTYQNDISFHPTYSCWKTQISGKQHSHSTWLQFARSHGSGPKRRSSSFISDSVLLEGRNLSSEGLEELICGSDSSFSIQTEKEAKATATPAKLKYTKKHTSTYYCS